MIFDGRPTSQIAAAEIASLVADRTLEDSFLDYKAMPYPHNPSGIHELLKDVSAFANAQGGYLIIGVGPDKINSRRPGGFQSVIDPERERQWMIDHCIEKVEPRLPELDIRGIEVNRNTILLCRILESAQKPHCTKPDREHHYFWRRYEDGNRLMTTPEIRQCLEGDRTLLELSAVKRELAHLRQQQIVVRESEQEITEGNAFHLQTPEAFRRFADQIFQKSAHGKPYYRLTATPLPINQISLRDKQQLIIQLLRRPPELRHLGWDLSTYLEEEHQISATGVQRTDIDHKHLRVYWNGHTEFWTTVDDFFFRLNGDMHNPKPEHQFLLPYGISEPVENFVLFARELCRIAGHEGEVEFTLEFYRIRGLFLAPGDPENWGYKRSRTNAGRPHGPQPFVDDNLIAQPIRVRAGDMPDKITWQLVSQVYYRFGYTDEQIPFFDQDHYFTLGRTKGGGAS